VLAARGNDWLRKLALFINILDNRPIGPTSACSSATLGDAAKTRVNTRASSTKNVFEMFWRGCGRRTS
jgi:hypothetical protein